MNAFALFMIALLIRALINWRNGVPFKARPLVRSSVPALVLRGGLGVVASLFFLLDVWPAYLTVPCILLSFPGPLIELVLVPSGVPYASYWFTRLSRLFGGKGDAAFNELRARLRSSMLLKGPRLEVLREQLFQGGTDESVRGSTLAARAVLDALEGNRESARELFYLGQELRPWLASRSVRAYCQAWLLADVAERGAWHEVLQLSTQGPFSFRRLFLRGVAERLLGLERGPSNNMLVLSWLLAPGRRQGLSLLQRARAQAPRKQRGPIASGVAGARTATFELIRLPRGAVTRAELRELGRAWESVLASGELRKRIEARQGELSASIDSDVIATRFHDDLIALFMRLWCDAPPETSGARRKATPESAEPELIQSAQDRLQYECLDQIERLVEALPIGKATSDRGLAHYWRSWARLRGLARSFTRVMPERRALLYDATGAHLLNHGAWLYNHELARVLSSDIFRWLLPLSRHDKENHGTLKRNVRLTTSV